MFPTESPTNQTEYFYSLGVCVSPPTSKSCRSVHSVFFYCISALSSSQPFPPLSLLSVKRTLKQNPPDNLPLGAIFSFLVEVKPLPCTPPRCHVPLQKRARVTLTRLFFRLDSVASHFNSALLYMTFLLLYDLNQSEPRCQLLHDQDGGFLTGVLGPRVHISFVN